MERHPSFLALLPMLAALACGGGDAPRPTPSGEPAATPAPGRGIGATRAAPAPPEGRAVAVFAGGCFWCMEGPFEALEGVETVLSGYAGGPEVGPGYEDVAHGRTGHFESGWVHYDAEVVG